MKTFLQVYMALGAVGVVSFVVGIFDKKRRRGWFWVAAVLFGLFFFEFLFVLGAVWMMMKFIH